MEASSTNKQVYSYHPLRIELAATTCDTSTIWSPVASDLASFLYSPKLSNPTNAWSSSSSSSSSSSVFSESSSSACSYFSPGLVRRALVKTYQRHHHHHRCVVGGGLNSTGTTTSLTPPPPPPPLTPRLTRRHQQNQPPLPKRSENIDFSELIASAQLHRALGAPPKNCSFCRSNGESELIYTSHCLKDARDKITCPILMRYQCPICGATGEEAHTINYCRANNKKRVEQLTKLTAALNANCP